MRDVQWEMGSTIGPLYLVGNASALKGVFWARQPQPMLASLKSAEADVLRNAGKQIEEYLAGKRQRFDLPLLAEGTEFQCSVWSELKKIPYGDTVSYRQIANRIRKDKAMRAVGTANGRNPLCLIVPCHRVIAADGSLGGYSGGVERKARLLALEKRWV